MNTYTILFFCIQACLVQNVFGQCLGQYGPVVAPAAGLAPLGYAGYGELAYPAAGWADGFGYGIGYGIDAYGGVGEGNVAVAGELPVAGTTAVAGQVPIMGAVKFGGDVYAGGAVTISGKCACSCADTPYWY